MAGGGTTMSLRHLLLLQTPAAAPFQGLLNRLEPRGPHRGVTFQKSLSRMQGPLFPCSPSSVSSPPVQTVPRFATSMHHVSSQRGKGRAVLLKCAVYTYDFPRPLRLSLCPLLPYGLQDRVLMRLALQHHQRQPEYYYLLSPPSCRLPSAPRSAS